MHIVIRKYHSNTPEEALVSARERFLPFTSKLPGFIHYYAFNAGEGVIVSVSIFNSEAEAVAATKATKEWLAQPGYDLFSGPPEVITGEVVVTG